MNRTVSIVVPIFNEEEILEARVAYLRETLSDFDDVEIVLTENGSVDNTKQLARELSQRWPNVRAVIDDGIADYGAALVNGINAATHDQVVILELDYLDLDYMRRAYAMLDEFDLIIGSKSLRPGLDQRPFQRRMFSWLYNFLLRHTLGLRLSETHGLKTLRKSRLHAITNGCVTSHAVWPSEFVIRAARTPGLRVTEISNTIPLREIRTTRISARKRLKKTLEDLLRLRRALRSGGPGSAKAVTVAAPERRA